MTVNGYNIEEAPNGAWWVRRPGGRRAWRFKTRRDALAFVGQLQAPTQEEQAELERRRDRRGTSAA